MARLGGRLSFCPFDGVLTGIGGGAFTLFAGPSGDAVGPTPKEVAKYEALQAVKVEPGNETDVGGREGAEGATEGP